MIYMPGQNYSDIARRLTSAGLSGETPCAIISRATTRQQRTHRTKVLDLHRAPQLAAPTLLVVGEVVRLADPVLVGNLRCLTSRRVTTLCFRQSFSTFLPQASSLGAIRSRWRERQDRRSAVDRRELESAAGAVLGV